MSGGQCDLTRKKNFRIIAVSISYFEQTLRSYRLSETKEIRTLVHYPLATLKKFSLLPSYHENFFLILGCACAQQVIFFFFALTSCGPPTHPGCSHAHCTCRSASALLLLSLASQAFCGLVSPFRLFCIFCWHLLVNALLAPGALPALLAPGALPAVGMLVALGSPGLEDL